MFKRIILFLALNFVIVLTLSLLTSVLGIQPYITQYGIDYGQLMAFCLVWGMGGAFISLFLSKMLVKWQMGVQIINPQTRDPDHQWLVQTVHHMARAAGLPKMPEVGIFDSPEPNAFATGPSRSNSLVAVSTGLLHRMNRSQVEGVLGHEVAHVANGDMVTMTLLQGVVNAFVMFLARAIAFAIANMGRRDDRESHSSPMAYYAIQFALEIVFMILGSMVVAWFSRYREYRADEGGARLAGRQNMIDALKALMQAHGMPQMEQAEATPAVKTLMINNRKKSWANVFASHPPLEERIRALETRSS